MATVVFINCKVSARLGSFSRSGREAEEKADVIKSRKRAELVCTTHFLIVIDRPGPIYTGTTDK